jgi:hypothetical protein
LLTNGCPRHADFLYGTPEVDCGNLLEAAFSRCPSLIPYTLADRNRLTDEASTNKPVLRQIRISFPLCRAKNAHANHSYASKGILQ